MAPCSALPGRLADEFQNRDDLKKRRSDSRSGYKYWCQVVKLNKTVLIFCAFDPELIRRSWNFCCLLKQVFHDSPLVVVANSPAAMGCNFPGADAKLEGSNIHWEWSAYDEGLAYAQRTYRDYDGMLFLNDSLCEHHVTLALAVAFEHHVNSKGGKFILGFEDVLPFSEKREVLLGMTISSWISAWMFYISRPALDEIAVLRTDVDSLLPEIEMEINGRTFFRKLPSVMGKCLFWHLFGGDRPMEKTPKEKKFGISWKNSMPLTRDNFGFFRSKLRSILMEFLLTARIRKVGEILNIRTVEACAYKIHRFFENKSQGKLID